MDLQVIVNVSTTLASIIALVPVIAAFLAVCAGIVVWQISMDI